MLSMIKIIIVFSGVQLILCDLSLLILHTNDMHARYEQVDRNLSRCKSNATDFCYGGFARLRGMADYFRTKAHNAGRHTLFLNAGDTFQGTPYYLQYGSPLAAKMMNALEMDAITLGNHEFDEGIHSLASYIDSLNAHVVCTNLDLSEVPSLQRPNLFSSRVYKVNGTKVGIVGYINPYISKNRDLGGLKVLDEIESIEKEAQKLKDEGVKIIIALGHSGYDKDMEVAKKVKDINVIVGGHTHTFLYSGKKIPEIEEPSGPYPTLIAQESGKQVPVVQAYYGTKYLGYLELDFDDEGNLKKINGSPILLIGFFPQDMSVLRELAPYKAEQDEHMSRIIGYSQVFLNNNNFKCKTSECEIGNLIADAYFDYMVEECPSVTINAAVMNAGGIRSSLDPVYGGHNGSITIGDVMTVIPWGKPLVVLRLPGKVLLQVLEHAISRISDTKISHVNNFLQVSGLRVTYNLAKLVGKQVSSVKVLCTSCTVPWFQRLKLDKIYGVVVPEHLAKGGEDFTMLTGFQRECVSRDVDYHVVAKYIERYTPVNPSIEGRILLIYKEVSEIIIPVFCCIIVVIFVVYVYKRCTDKPTSK